MGNEKQTIGLPGVPGFVLPSVVLAALAVFAYFSFRPPLETSRPETSTSPSHRPPTPLGIDNQFSRLWEDPLAFRGQVATSGLADQVDRLSDPGRRDRNKRAELDKIATYFKFLAFPELLHPADASRSQPSDQETTPPKLLCLPVLVPGSPYADDEETRKRIRYALLAALTTHGYVLSYPDRMSWVELPVWVDIRGVGSTRRVDLPVPVKLLAPDGVVSAEEPEGEVRAAGADRLLICWINQAQLGDRPLCVIAQVLAHLFHTVDETDKRKIQVKIIGPADSGTLLSMAHEETNWKQWMTRVPEESVGNRDEHALSQYEVASKKGFTEYHEDSTLFSPRATVAPQSLDKVRRGWLDAFTSPGRRENCGLAVVRSIGTDRDLVIALRRELAMRRVLPEGTASKKHIVLIGERDTLYGRAISYLFESEGVPKEYLHRYTYLRGIDGEIAKNQAMSKTDGKRGGQDERAYPLPEGPSQLDYLRRLETQIAQLQDRLNQEDGSRISAFGVVGTDLYDKLLVLRALRKGFPQALFFTTDLDDRLTHQSEYPWTRNLLVASHFGLNLHPDVNKVGSRHSVPPFRDSYQTSIFLTTLLALEDEHLKINGAWPQLFTDPWGVQCLQRQEPLDYDNDAVPKDYHRTEYLDPLIFEIAKSDAYQLTMPGTQSAETLQQRQEAPDKAVKPSVSAHVHPPSSRQRPWWSTRYRCWKLLVAVGCLAVCLAVNFRFLRDAFGGKYKGVKLGVLLLLIAVLVPTIWLDQSALGGEPFLLFEGISVWPTTLLRCFAVLVSFIFVFAAAADLRKNRQQVSVQYFGASAGQPSSGGGADESSKPNAASRARVARDRHRSMKEVRRRMTQWVQLFLARAQRLVRDPHRLVDKIRDDISILNWRRGEEDDVDVEPAIIFREYGARGRIGNRVLRTLAVSFFYMVFGVLIFMIGAPTEFPARSRLAEVVGKSALFFAVMFLVFLVFFVLDSTQLCRQFVRLLANSTKSWPVEGTLRFGGSRGEADPDVLRERMIIGVIAYRTHHVGKLIKYPFIVILILLVSRHSIFDNWSWSWPLIIVMTLNLGGVVLCGFILRRECVRAREKVVKRLNDQLAVAIESADPIGKERIKHVISEVKDERGGGFRPLAEDPVVQAMAIPFGGVGGLILIEQLFSNL